MLKRIILSSVISFCSVFALLGLEPGGWINDVSRKIETPHLKWAENLSFGPIEVLFVTSNGAALHYQKPTIGARMIVEWAQRMDMNYSAVTGGRGCSRDKDNPRLTFDFFHPTGYRGIQPDEKEHELAGKLKRKVELYIFNHISFDALSPESQKVILEEVIAGAGIVFIGETRNKLPKMFKTPDLKLADAILRLNHFPCAEYRLKKVAGKVKNLWKKDSLPLRTYKLGKGRIVQLTGCYDPANSVIFYMPEWINKFQKKSNSEKQRIRYYNEAPIPIWWGEFENLNARFLRVFYYASGRQIQVPLSCEELHESPLMTYGRRSVLLQLDNPEGKQGKVCYRIRNDENKVLFSGESSFRNKQVKLKLPLLPGGKYSLDVQSYINGKLDDFGIQCFSIKPNVDVTIEMKDDRIYDGMPIHVVTKLSEPVITGKACITLADSPYDRIWFKKEYKLNGNTRQTFSLDGWYLPNSAATLRIEIKSNTNVVAYARKTLFRPEGNRLPPWIDLIWGESLTPLHILMNQSAQGWQGTVRMVNGNWGTSIQNFMVTGEICFPWGPLSNWYVYNNQYKRSVGYMCDPKSKESRANWNLYEGGAQTFGATKEEMSKLDKMPDGMEYRPTAVKDVMKIWNNSIRPFDYGVKAYTLGDETKPGYDTFRGKYATLELQRFLKRKFKTIQNLNNAWKRSYKSFDEIPLLSTKEAISKKLFPEGAAQRDFAEVNYFDVYTTIGRYIDSKVAGAFYGPTSSVICEEFNYPELNASFAHPETEMIELIRTMRPNSLYLPLYGYEIKQAAYSNKKFWENVISGVGRGNMYFAGNIYPEGGTLCVDFKDKMARLTQTRLMLQKGLGPLIHQMKVKNGDMAILTSSSSQKAHLFMKEFVSASRLSTSTLYKYANENAIVIDNFTAKVLDEFINKYKVLFLAGVSSLSKENAEKIVKFAENGGVVIADLNPAIFNEHLAAYDQNPLVALFGDIKPSSIKGFNEYKGANVQGVKGIQPMMERKIGKGKSILMNFTLAGLRDAFGDSRKFNDFMDELMQKLAIRSKIEVSFLPKNSCIRYRHTHDFDMIAFANDTLASHGKGGGDVTVSFPKSGYVYQIGNGFLKKGKNVNIPFNPPFCFLTQFARKQKPPVIKLSSNTASPGIPLLLALSSFEKGRVLNCQLRDPVGRLIRPRNEMPEHELIIIDGKTDYFPIHFAYNDPEGEYELVLTDIATGLTRCKKIILKAGASR